MNTAITAYRLYDNAYCDLSCNMPTPDYLRGYAMGAFGITLSKSVAQEICQARMQYEAVGPWEPQRYREIVEKPLTAMILKMEEAE